MKKAIQKLANDNRNEIVAIRKHIHANPELSYCEFETTKFIAKKLTEFGIDYDDTLLETGLVAKIEGKNPAKKTIALRADIDALPIQEANDVTYKSTNDGVMHACGHDVHSACLLGAAKILQSLKDKFEGTIKLIFQPAEEKHPGGASLMIDKGVLEDVESITALHVHPPMEVGKVGFRSGLYMASSDELILTVKGQGGHGALPQNVIDPVLISAHLIVALQQIVSRNANPAIPSVLSFGGIKSTGIGNVIPNEVILEGTFRTMNETWRNEAHKRIKTMAENLCKSMGAACHVFIKKGYPCLINDDDMTANAKFWATDYLGAENVEELPLRMTSEDFSSYTLHCPGLFFRIGTANKQKGITSPVHTPTFDVDMKALKIGSGLMAWLAYNQLMG